MLNIFRDIFIIIRDNGIIIALGLIIAGIIYFLLNYKNSVKPTHDTIECYTGTLGSGKTFSAVKRAIKTYKRYALALKIKKIINPFMTKEKLNELKPILYSNIPIRYKKVWSTKLTDKHLIFEERLQGRPIVLIDEVGSVAGQNDYTNYFVVNKFSNYFVRFYRHGYNTKLILTDQSVSSIYKGVRVRLGQIYNLSDFRKKFFFFYKINCKKLDMIEDSIGTNVNLTNNAESPYLFGLIGKTFKYYDSRCYSPLVTNLPYSKEYLLWNERKTTEFIVLPYKKLLSSRTGESNPTIINPEGHL